MTESVVGQAGRLREVRSRQTRSELEELEPVTGSAASLAVHLENHPTVIMPIDSLILGNTPRQSEENAEHIRVLAEAVDRLPPITVHRRTMRVIDGIHRVRAAQSKGWEVIEARLIDCDDDTAYLIAVHANVTHGLPLTLADRKAAARHIVGIHPEWSDRAIAAAAGISHKTVGAIRARTTGEIPHLDTRLGKDGRMHSVNTAAKRREAAALMRADPAAGLRSVARATGLSPSTVRDVVQRTGRGEDPVPARYREPGAQATAERCGGDDPARADGDPGARVPARAAGVDRGAVLEKLSNDPSVRFSDSGRQAIRWLQRHAVAPEAMRNVGSSLPNHWAPVVADLARSCAAAWAVLAEELEHRVRPDAG